MYNIMMNGEYLEDAEGKLINYRTKEDALCALSYLDLTPSDTYAIMHYTQVMELEAAMRDLEEKSKC